MAEKTTGTKNQDKVGNPQMNERPEEKGYAQINEERYNEHGSTHVEIPAENKGQENLQQRGFQEDQPKNPVRGTGSTAPDQQEHYRQPGDKYPEDGDKISS